jgi:hypothetical protein
VGGRYRFGVPIGSRDRVEARPRSASVRPPADERGGGGARSGPGPRRSVPARRRLWALVIVLVLVVTALAGAAYAVTRVIQSVTPTCTASVDGETYRIDREQAANARTIADVATEVGMPHHAVTVALAAALQESKMSNISHGDRDSVGLFQQRPSQGWGTPEQLTTPRYAAAAFYRQLARVDGWETMSVTEAAQHVQRSAAPDAYAKWEPEARVLARILTGEVPNRIVCH